MILFPAIDLRDGQVVRLTEGDYGRMNVYGLDPVRTAEGFCAAGASHLHVVDLDGAKDGAPRNLGVIRKLAQVPGLFVQAGGGIRTAERVESYLGMGIGRVILGTAALRDPDFLSAMVRAHGARIAVGVDAQDGMAAVGGWLETTGTDAMDFCKKLRDMGVQTVIYTDISRDGTLRGTNLAAYRALSEIHGFQVVASGGISGIQEIGELADMGIYGAIVGKALYERKLDLKAALKAAGGEASA